jgi:formamidopyrimidine-DNA glycosylase
MEDIYVSNRYVDLSRRQAHFTQFENSEECRLDCTSFFPQPTMVEGPGATRNGRKVQQAIGFVVKDVDQEQLREKLQNRRLDQVFSVGKELFLLFLLDDSSDDEEAIALRLHFGMNGCLYLTRSGNSSNAVPPWRRNTASSLILKLESPNESSSPSPPASALIIIETKDSRSSFVSANVAKSKLNRLGNRDVCGSNFDPDAVLEAILEKRSTAMISDAVLDQERFPGVGNIIKIEGLHRSRIHPRRIVSTLSREELKSVICNCRDFAMAWLSSGRAPHKAVYNQTQCGTCRGFAVRMVKLGNDLSRVTFWCVMCQPLSVNQETSEQNRPQVSLATKDASYALNCTPCCPQHGSASLLLRRVRKVDSSNRNRLFRICKVGSCPYFSWADTHLPSCRCQQKAILRVSKTERTGGRWFLSCRNGAKQHPPSNQGCSFFSWADPSHLKSLGRSLTPLL